LAQPELTVNPNPSIPLKPFANSDEPLAGPSVSSQYAYNEAYSDPSAYYQSYDYSGYQDAGVEASSSAAAYDYDDNMMRKLGYKPKDGPIQFMSINQAEQVGEDWKLEAAKNMTSQQPSQSIAVSFSFVYEWETFTYPRSNNFDSILKPQIRVKGGTTLCLLLTMQKVCMVYLILWIVLDPNRYIAREQQLQDQYAQRKVSKSIARMKYGF
jgi:hypothetical protein